MERKVLIVDDERSIVDILKYNIEKDGTKAICAYDGKEGLRLARTEDPDVILLDVMLPEMDGFEVCRTLRAEGNNVPIIMITAREEETDKVFGLDLGADDYITKPFSMRRNGHEIELTQREYELIKYLAENPGKVMSREELMSAVWQYDYFGDLRAVDVAVRRLREKVEDNPSEPQYVITKRGAGYYFAD